jgi:hypothetical protein
MSFLKNIFGKKAEPIKNNGEFWDWFRGREKSFFNVVKSGKGLENGFFNELSAKLSELKEGYFYVTGMLDDSTVELVFTADGNIKNIAFVEALVSAAPAFNGWKFTALKPAMDIQDVGIKMAGYTFVSDNIFFYSNDHSDYPDEIDISVIHNDLTDSNRKQIENGVCIFLDNYLGELEFVNTIDNLTIIGRDEAEKELIPIVKLKDFLTWRQKEFIEKYQGVWYDTEEDEYALYEQALENGHQNVAIINTDLLQWDSKASHPWVAIITFKYKGIDGMPNESDYESLQQIEESILQELLDKDGYLYVGRQTAENERDIYFVCKDFRKPSIVFFNMQKAYSKRFGIEYTIYKDKYWQSFERFK